MTSRSALHALVEGFGWVVKQLLWIAAMGLWILFWVGVPLAGLLLLIKFVQWAWRPVGH